MIPDKENLLKIIEDSIKNKDMKNINFIKLEDGENVILGNLLLEASYLSLQEKGTLYKLLLKHGLTPFTNEELAKREYLARNLIGEHIEEILQNHHLLDQGSLDKKELSSAAINIIRSLYQVEALHEVEREFPTRELIEISLNNLQLQNLRILTTRPDFDQVINNDNLNIEKKLFENLERFIDKHKTQYKDLTERDINLLADMVLDKGASELQRKKFVEQINYYIISSDQVKREILGGIILDHFRDVFPGISLKQISEEQVNKSILIRGESRTPLEWAVKLDNVESAKILISKGAKILDINYSKESGFGRYIDSLSTKYLIERALSSDDKKELDYVAKSRRDFFEVLRTNDFGNRGLKATVKYRQYIDYIDKCAETSSIPYKSYLIPHQVAQGQESYYLMYLASSMNDIMGVKKLVEAGFPLYFPKSISQNNLSTFATKSATNELAYYLLSISLGEQISYAVTNARFDSLAVIHEKYGEEYENYIKQNLDRVTTDLRKGVDKILEASTSLEQAREKLQVKNLLSGLDSSSLSQIDSDLKSYYDNKKRRENLSSDGKGNIFIRISDSIVGLAARLIPKVSEYFPNRSTIRMRSLRRAVKLSRQMIFDTIHKESESIQGIRFNDLQIYRADSKPSSNLGAILNEYINESLSIKRELEKAVTQEGLTPLQLAFILKDSSLIDKLVKNGINLSRLFDKNFVKGLPQEEVIAIQNKYLGTQEAVNRYIRYTYNSHKLNNLNLDFIPKSKHQMFKEAVLEFSKTQPKILSKVNSTEHGYGYYIGLSNTNVGKRGRNAHLYDKHSLALAKIDNVEAYARFIRAGAFLDYSLLKEGSGAGPKVKEFIANYDLKEAIQIAVKCGRLDTLHKYKSDPLFRPISLVLSNDKKFTQRLNKMILREVDKSYKKINKAITKYEPENKEKLIKEERERLTKIESDRLGKLFDIKGEEDSIDININRALQLYDLSSKFRSALKLIMNKDKKPYLIAWKSAFKLIMNQNTSANPTLLRSLKIDINDLGTSVANLIKDWANFTPVDSVNSKEVLIKKAIEGLNPLSDINANDKNGKSLAEQAIELGDLASLRKIGKLGGKILQFENFSSDNKIIKKRVESFVKNLSTEELLVGAIKNGRLDSIEQIISQRKDSISLWKRKEEEYSKMLEEALEKKMKATNKEFAKISEQEDPELISKMEKAFKESIGYDEVSSEKDLHEGDLFSKISHTIFKSSDKNHFLIKAKIGIKILLNKFMQHITHLITQHITHLRVSTKEKSNRERKNLLPSKNGTVSSRANKGLTRDIVDHLKGYISNVSNASKEDSGKDPETPSDFSHLPQKNGR